MIQKFWIDCRLPDFTEITETLKNSKGATYQQQCEKLIEKVQASIKNAVLVPVRAAMFDFIWVEPSSRRSKDEIAAGGRRIIFDALIRSGVIRDAGWNHIINWTDHFHTIKNKKYQEPGVMVVITDADAELNRVKSQISQNDRRGL